MDLLCDIIRCFHFSNVNYCKMFLKYSLLKSVLSLFLRTHPRCCKIFPFSKYECWPFLFLFFFFGKTKRFNILFLQPYHSLKNNVIFFFLLWSNYTYIIYKFINNKCDKKLIYKSLNNSIYIYNFRMDHLSMTQLITFLKY